MSGCEKHDSIVCEPCAYDRGYKAALERAAGLRVTVPEGNWHPLYVNGYMQGVSGMQVSIRALADKLDADCPICVHGGSGALASCPHKPDAKGGE